MAALANDAQKRVLLVASHPVQYAVPQYRLLAQRGDIEILLAYCSLRGAEAALDPGFGVEVQWDVPLMDGYPWVHLPNISPWAGARSFLDLVNPGLWSLVRHGGFDAIALFTGYTVVSFWIAALAARTSAIPLLFGTDGFSLDSRSGSAMRAVVKRRAWPALFRLADVAIVPSSGGVALMRSLGLPDERIALTPYVVDNWWWVEKALQVDRQEVRRSWGIPEEDFVILFSAKLAPWKRPEDLLQAFAALSLPDAWLVFAGDGALRASLECDAHRLGVAEKVRFLGFVNQSRLPAAYVASDVLVLPSAYEPFGVVTNEAMLCGRPVIVSDQVGARFDLVTHGETGFMFPVGDVGALTALLRTLHADRGLLQRLSRAARERMEEWTPEQNADAFVHAVQQAVAFRKGR